MVAPILFEARIRRCLVGVLPRVKTFLWYRGQKMRSQSQSFLVCRVDCRPQFVIGRIFGRRGMEYVADLVATLPKIRCLRNVL